MELFERLVDAIALTQSALLGGHLHELECGLTKQAELCRQLEPLIAMVKDIATSPRNALLPAASKALDRGRVLASVLRRVRLTLSAQAAVHATPLTYGPPAVPSITRSR